MPDERSGQSSVADTDADHIKTALARVVLACALKHHTRRGNRDPERWQRASQLVTHGLLRDAGFVLPPEAEALDGISVEQAYDRLPEPSADAEDPGDASSSSDVDASGSAAGCPFHLSRICPHFRVWISDSRAPAQRLCGSPRCLAGR